MNITILRESRFGLLVTIVVVIVCIGLQCFFSGDANAAHWRPCFQHVLGQIEPSQEMFIVSVLEGITSAPKFLGMLPIPGTRDGIMVQADVSAVVTAWNVYKTSSVKEDIIVVSGLVTKTAAVSSVSKLAKNARKSGYRR